MTYDGGGWTLCYDNAEAYDDTQQVTNRHTRNNTTALGAGTYARHCQSMTSDLNQPLLGLLATAKPSSPPSAPSLMNGNYYVFAVQQGDNDIGIELQYCRPWARLLFRQLG